MFVLRHKTTGEIQTVSSTDGYPLAEYDVMGEAERGQDFDEEWDVDAGEWKLDGLAATDRAAGEDHIRRMHAMKHAEAVLHLSLATIPGVTITEGIIVEEAAALGVLPADLAQTVLDEAAADREKEVARRLAKEQIRSGGGA